MREIEIKVAVSDEPGILQKLDNLGIQLGEPKKQHDVVYGVTKDGAFIQGQSWLRIRTENDKTVYFTLKKSVTAELDSIEHEVIVDDAIALEKIITTLGFELYSDLTKTRRKGQYGKIELCLDEIPELGTYIEGELLCEEDVDVSVVKDELWRLFEQLGLSKDNQATVGYDVLMRRHQGLDITK